MDQQPADDRPLRFGGSSRSPVVGMVLVFTVFACTLLLVDRASTSSATKEPGPLASGLAAASPVSPSGSAEYASPKPAASGRAPENSTASPEAQPTAARAGSDLEELPSDAWRATYRATGRMHLEQDGDSLDRHVPSYFETSWDDRWKAVHLYGRDDDGVLGLQLRCVATSCAEVTGADLTLPSRDENNELTLTSIAVEFVSPLPFRSLTNGAMSSTVMSTDSKYAAHAQRDGTAWSMYIEPSGKGGGPEPYLTRATMRVRSQIDTRPPWQQQMWETSAEWATGRFSAQWSLSKLGASQYPVYPNGFPGLQHPAG